MLIVKRLCSALLLCAASVVSLALYGPLALYLYLAHDLPDVRPLREPDGVLGLMTGLGCSSPPLHPARFEELPPHVVSAFLAAWDQRFFAETDLRLMKGGCGDLIFQELAKRLLPETRRPSSHRAKLLILMARMEVLLTREQIFMAWLNVRSFGNGVCGLDAAARFYFAKPVARLNLAEAAALAVLSENAGRGRGAEEYMKMVRRRQEWLLSGMAEAGTITRAEYEAALAAPLSFALCRGLSVSYPAQP